MTLSTVTRLLTEAVIFIVAIGKVLETFREQAASAPRLAKSSSKGAAHKSVRSDFFGFANAESFNMHTPATGRSLPSVTQARF